MRSTLYSISVLNVLDMSVIRKIINNPKHTMNNSIDDTVRKCACQIQNSKRCNSSNTNRNTYIYL